MAYQLPQEDDIRAFLTTPPPRPDWVIEGLEPGDVGIISAPGGTGKSMFCLSVGIGVASGSPLFGQWDVDAPGDVLYLYAEDQPATVHRRLYLLGGAWNNIAAIKRTGRFGRRIGRRVQLFGHLRPRSSRHRRRSAHHVH